jgi:hypothetical protein
LSLLASLGLLPSACGGSSESVRLPTCSSPQTNSQTGEVACGEGYVYKPESNRCKPGQVDDRSRSLPALTQVVDCTADASVCDAYRFSVCQRTSDPFIANSCSMGCATDDDCSPGSHCVCNGGAFGTCSWDSCDSDADCEEGYHCASTPQGCGSSSFSCQKPDDECFSAKDCSGGYNFCSDNGEGRRCGAGVVCGRPFLVESEGRVAATVARADWARSCGNTPDSAGLSRAERLALAEHWTRMGQMEHASIAAFARFSLQLLSLGAPPELVEACTQALADETAHTQLCFGIASAYAGHAIGPGPLDVSDSLNVTSLSDIVDLVIAEGCFGETGAALAALDAAGAATDPVIAAAYARIAADEQRHAELAFRFVRWALASGGSAVSERIEAALESELGQGHAARNVAAPCLSALVSLSRVA